MMWSDCTFSSLNGGVSILLLTVICISLLHFIFSWKRKGLPPGPKYHLPFIGNLHQINPDMRITLRKFRREYGDVYSLSMGTKLVIVISGYNAIKEVFLRNGETFSNRPSNMKIIEKVTQGLGIINVSGKLWQDQRRFALQTLKYFGMGRSILEEKIHGEVKWLIRELKKCHNSVIDPKLAISTSIANIISSLCFGGQFKHNDQGFKDILEKLNETFYLAGVSAVLHFIPSLELLPGDLFCIKKVIANEEYMFQFVKEVVEQHIENYDEHRISDFTSAYIKEMKSQASNTSTTFTVDQLAKVIIDLFAAGTETTSTALRWALVYLVNYPDLQEEMYEAILKVTGTERLPSIQEKTKLPQVDAFMMEVMRHAQLVFTSLSHATTEDFYFRGFLIPPDALILPDLDSVNHDSAIWGDPDVFRPNRYISNDNTLLNPEEFIPFFLGKRHCLGESLAKMELFLFLSAIVQNFKITAPSGEDMSLKNIDGLFGLVHSPKDFRILIQSRKSSLYMS